MKRSLLAMSVLSAMLIACSSAAAGGVNLAWTNCASEGGTTNRTSTCLVNTGSDALVGSFVLNTDQAGCTGIEIVVDIIVGEGSRRSPRGGT
jgi:P pilus assembly chaperone PapD